MPANPWVTLPRAFIALLALYALLEWGFDAQAGAPVVFIAAAICGAALAVRWVRRSIWSLRNRLSFAWIFIGVVPIALILLLAAVGTYFVTGQIAVYLVTAELERRAALLETPARALVQAPYPDPAGFAQMGAFLEQRMPGVRVALFRGDEVSMQYPPAGAPSIPSGGWKDYTGFVGMNGTYYSAAVVSSRGATAVALAPIGPEVLKNTVSGIGGAMRIGIDGAFSGAIPQPATGWEKLDLAFPWFNRIRVANWGGSPSAESEILFVTTRPSAVLKTVFSNGIDSAQTVTIVFAVVFCLLLIVQIASWAAGISLTRSVTQAVHGMYEGTERIARGDFAWRIPVRGTDQLAELGQSFNAMTAKIENLVVIAKEKERLQSEVEIAGEVQNQLFPQSPPAMPTIELIGVCRPARMVSGDYYDYLRLPNGNLAIAIGDVAGKGISAALLMASIQSIVRTQLASGVSSVSTVVAQLNRQLHASTAPEKFATFFFGIYDATSGTLTYTNAGHVPPLLLRNGGTHVLEVTGTVVGAFPSMHYGEESIAIHPGDVLIAYTDGVTEPENSYGEEFGSGRIAETALRYPGASAKEIVERIMEAVSHWSATPELPDDMTVLIARSLA